MGEVEAGEALRIDKWLWAARFFKTRGLALEAVTGGKVHLNGKRIKPARRVRVGDELRIRRGPYECVLHVRGICAQRRPAGEAQLLYEETPASREAREGLVLQRRVEDARAQKPAGRPNKKDRRHIIRFIRRQG